MIALKESIEIYAWAPKPYHKFMAFKSFTDLAHRPLLIDMTIEEGVRLKVVYGSTEGFHAVDLDSGAVYDVYIPAHVSPHLLLFTEHLAFVWLHLNVLLTESIPADAIFLLGFLQSSISV